MTHAHLGPPDVQHLTHFSMVVVVRLLRFQKTHTIMGPNPTAAASHDDADAGVIPRAVTAIFQSLAEQKAAQSAAGADLDYQVSVQFLELYGEEIRDLLTANRSGGSEATKLTIRDAMGSDEPEVVGATQTTVTTAPHALQCLAHGMLRRVTGATAMNESSSRSHAIFSVCLEQSVVVKSVGAAAGTGTNAAASDDGSSSNNNDDHVQVTRSKFNFVDLAGAERQKRTGATGKRLQEGIDINKGLSNLGNVISALGDPKKRGKTHVPYRDAKLTRLLKGSLGGNHKTLMIACVSPAAVNMGESLNCLRYANRAKNIQNKAFVNVDANTRLVQELRGQVKALASDLLKVLDGDTGTQFTRDALVALVEGTSGSAAVLPTPTKQGRVAPDADERLQVTESELRRTRDLLRQTRSNQDAAELELHTVRAQNNLRDAKKHFAALAADEITGTGPVHSIALEKAFLDKAVAYEANIARLQGALRSAESSLRQQQQVWHRDGPADFDEHIEETLRVVRAALLPEGGESDFTCRPPSSYDFELSTSSTRNSEQLDAEEKVERADLEILTNKYLKQGGLVEDDDEEFEQTVAPIEASSVSDQRAKQVVVDLEELSQSIQSKERLISQIKRNKEREAVRNAHSTTIADGLFVI